MFQFLIGNLITWQWANEQAGIELVSIPYR